VESGQLDRAAVLQVVSVESEIAEDVESRAANQWYRITARGASGKDIRQLFERQGAIVSRILRTAFGPLQLDRSIARGQHRALTTNEMTALGIAAATRVPVKPAGRRSTGPLRRGLPGPKARRKER
jgi:23S rRNA pseudouridine2605 synthase